MHTVATFATESTTNLGGNATFTGTAKDTTGSWSKIRAAAFADQAGNLDIEQSRNNSTWRRLNTVAVVASTPVALEANIVMRYVRVVFRNGAAAQGSFELVSALIPQ